MPAALTPKLLEGARFLYVLPNFQNPTGRRMPLARRQELAKIAKQAGLLVLEDDPYAALSYSGDALPTLLSMMPDQVVHMGSFSKVLAPGLRVGYVIAPPDVHRKLVQAKQAADLHTPSFTQRIVYEAVKDGFLDTHIPTIRALYGERCKVMLDAMKEHFPAGVTLERAARRHVHLGAAAGRASTASSCSTRRSRRTSRSCRARRSSRTSRSSTRCACRS